MDCCLFSGSAPLQDQGCSECLIPSRAATSAGIQHWVCKRSRGREDLLSLCLGAQVVLQRKGGGVISLVVQAGPAEQSHPLPSAQILPRPHTLGMLSFGENVTHNSHKACASFPPSFFSERGRSDWTPEASGCVELLILLSLLVVVAVMTSLPSFLPVNLRLSAPCLSRTWD